MIQLIQLCIQCAGQQHHVAADISPAHPLGEYVDVLRRVHGQSALEYHDVDLVLARIRQCLQPAH